MRKRSISAYFQYPAEPRATAYLPRDCSVDACLRTLRDGLRRFEERCCGLRQMERVSADRLFREMMLSLRWLTHRAAGEFTKLSPQDCRIARATGLSAILYWIDLDAIRCREWADWRSEVRVMRLGVSALEKVVRHSMQSGDGWGLRGSVWFEIEMGLRIKRVAAQSEILQTRRVASDPPERVAQAAEHRKLEKMLSQGLDGTKTHERIAASKQSKPALHPASHGRDVPAAATGIVMTSNTAERIERHFTHFRAEGIFFGGDFETFWAEVVPLLGRIAEGSQVTLDDVREHVDAGVVAIHRVSDETGDAVFVTAGVDVEIEDAPEKVTMMIGATDSAWPHLDHFIGVVRQAAAIAHRPIVLFDAGINRLPIPEGFSPLPHSYRADGAALIDRQAA